MKKNILCVIGIVIGGLWISGCKDNPSSPAAGISETDKSDIRLQIESDALYTSDATLLDDGGATTINKADVAITPRGWGRTVESVSRNVSYDQQNDTTVVATITTTMTGTVYIRARYAGQTTDTTVKKPFTENTVRKVKFVKGTKRWGPREVSAMQGGTAGGTVQITELKAYMGSDTLDVTDPLNYFLSLGFPGRRGMPMMSSFYSGDIKLQVTVTSADPDTDIVVLHRPFQMFGSLWKPLSKRMTMVSSTPSGSQFVRVYELGWKGVIAGRFHYAVSALTKSSLFDDVAPFSSQIWGVPFIVQ